MGYVFPLVFCLSSRLTEQTYATVYPCVRSEEIQIRNQIAQVLGGGHRRIRDPINEKYITKQHQIEDMVGHYETYEQKGNILGYLRTIGYHFKTGPPPPAAEAR